MVVCCGPYAQCMCTLGAPKGCYVINYNQLIGHSVQCFTLCGSPLTVWLMCVYTMYYDVDTLHSVLYMITFRERERECSMLFVDPIAYSTEG